MKIRLDQQIADKEGISRSKAQAIIMAGEVSIEGCSALKAGQLFDAGVKYHIKEKFPYVSRGALKLEKAASEFEIDFKNKVICDVGASTGGFTDFVLQHGAEKVLAIDVGHGQLDQKLRNNPRVLNLEKVNFKSLEELPQKVDIFVIDVSFISLKKILPVCFKLEKTAPVIALIKPQFEVGKKIVDIGRGVVTSKADRDSVVEDIKGFSESIGYKVEGITESPITGAKGNVEYLIYLRS
jgi:23S rRNA (cytidine1920-2'-O)/16S rRNA (cytidine1409-2'-O)-methyltransferase